MSESTAPEVGTLKPLPPKDHYNLSMWSLSMSDDPNHEHDRTNLILTALAHAFLGGLSSELQYRAERELAESQKSGYGAADNRVRIEEEDDDRP